MTTGIRYLTTRRLIMGFKRKSEDNKRNKFRKNSDKVRRPRIDRTEYDRCDGCGEVIEVDSLTPTPYGDMCGFCLKP